MDQTEFQYQQEHIAFWDNIACHMDFRYKGGHYYHERLCTIYQFLVPSGLRILEIGCSHGDLIAALKPSFGVGIDFSNEMIIRAKQRYPDLHFIQADAHTLCLKQKFDIIILSDLLNDLWDVQVVLEQFKDLITSRTRIIINSYSRLWSPPLALARRLSLAKPNLPQNWLTVEDITNLLQLTDFEIIRHWPEIFWPLHTPILASFSNRFLAKLWPFKYFNLTNFILARPQVNQETNNSTPIVSVIVPARNEAGNIPDIMARVPEMGSGTEIVFVEGHSDDNTYTAIQQAILDHPERSCKLLQQSGVGKGDAVRKGFSHAEGEILIILDADLTVPPEDLPRFCDALMSGKGEFMNGIRLVYPMEKQAMRFFNLIGNKFFSLAFSWLLGQPVKDTLCGTKAIWKMDYERIASNREYFGDFDPFGDFDLLFGAAKLNLKIVDMPIRYRERVYGATNIHRWKHGWLLIKMSFFAAERFKFV